MYKRRSIQLLLILCLLSFPLSAFASGELPTTVTGNVSSVSPGSAMLNATSTDDGTLEYGFQFGETSAYGSDIKSIDAFASYVPYLKLGNANGNSGSGDGEFNYPQDSTVGPNGNIYVVDRYNNRIQIFNSDGEYVSQFSSYNGNNLEWIQGITTDADGNVYVADRVLVKFDAQGNWLETFSLNGFLNYVYDVTLDADGNIRIISDNKVMVLSSTGELLTTYGQSGYGDGEFSNASSLTLDAAGNTYVTDTNNNKVVKFDSQNIFAGNLNSSGGDGDGYFSGPSGVVVRSDGHILISNRYNNSIKEFDENGNYIKVLLSYDDGLHGPDKINIDSNGNLFVASQYNASVSIFALSDSTNKSFALKAENLDCSTTYHYRSFSTNASGTSYGDDKTFTTSECAPGLDTFSTTPAATSIFLEWDEIQNASYYTVAYREVGTSFWYTDEVGRGSSYHAVGLTSETEYEFRIAGVSNNNERTAWSPAQNATTTVQAHYNISTCEQLQAIGESRITHQLGDFNGYYVLTNDIDCSDTANWQWEPLSAGDGAFVEFGGFKPILDANFMSEQASGFRGTLDGAGHKISHIRQVGNFVGGVFGVLQGGTVKDIIFDDLQITMKTNEGIVGTVVASSDGPSVLDHVIVNGSVATMPSNGPVRASLSYPQSVDFDLDGNINVLGDQGITKVDSASNYISTFANVGDSRINSFDVATDSEGNLYGSSSDNYSNVLKLSPTGELLNSFGSDILSNPNGFAIDDNDSLYVVDNNKKSVFKFDSDGNNLQTIKFPEDSQMYFDYIQDVAVASNGDLYIADQNKGIYKFNANGDFVNFFAIYPGGDDTAQRGQPNRLQIAPNGDLYILSDQASVYRYTLDGVFIGSRSLRDSGLSQCNDYSDNITVGSNGDIYVPCRYSYKVSVYDSELNYKSILGGPTGGIRMGMGVVGGLVGAPGLIGGEENSKTTVEGLNIINSQANVDIDYVARGNTEVTAVVGGVIGYGVDRKAKISQSSATGHINYESQNPSVGLVDGGLGGILLGVNVKDSYSTKDINVSGIYTMLITGGVAGQTMEAGFDNVYSSGDIDSRPMGTKDGSIASGGIAYLMNVADNSEGSSAPNLSVGLRNSFVTSNVMGAQFNSEQSSIEDINFNEFPTGAVSGLVYGVGGNLFKGNAFDATSTGLNVCVGVGFDVQTEEIANVDSDACSIVNEGGTDPNYFFGNSTNGPLASWDFENVWKSNSGALPTLRGTAQIEPPIDNGDGGGDLPPEVDNGTSSGNGNTQVEGAQKAKSFSDLIKKKTKPIVTPGVVAKDVPSAAAVELPTKEKLARVLGETNSKTEKLEAIGKPKAGSSRNMFPVFVSGMCGLSVLAYAGWFLISRRKNRFVDDTLGPYGY